MYLDSIVIIVYFFCDSKLAFFDSHSYIICCIVANVCVMVVAITSVMLVVLLQL